MKNFGGGGIGGPAKPVKQKPSERGKTRGKEKFEVTRHTALLRKLKSETHCRLASEKRNLRKMDGL